MYGNVTMKTFTTCNLIYANKDVLKKKKENSERKERGREGKGPKRSQENTLGDRRYQEGEDYSTLTD
jgi:hypothetical protein